MVQISLLNLDKTQNLKKSSQYSKLPHNFFQTRFYLTAPALTVLLYLDMIRYCCQQNSDKIVLDLTSFGRIFCRSRRESVFDVLSTLEQYQLVSFIFSTYREIDREREKRQETSSPLKDAFKKYMGKDYNPLN